jgi:hypothetical protein
MKRRAAASLALSMMLVAATCTLAATSPAFTSAKAVAYIKTGKGARPGSQLEKHPLPTREHAFALRFFRSGPYTSPALNFWYAIDATKAKYATAAMKRRIRRVVDSVSGRRALEDEIAGGVKRVDVVYYGASARALARAAVRGTVAGVSS